ncbi:MAG: hypothetical protein QMB24_13655 [Spirosomataceae bacterium]
MENKINVCLIASVVLITLGCGKDSGVNPADSCNNDLDLYGKQVSTFTTTPPRQTAKYW